MFCFLLSNRDFLHPFHARILQGAETHASAMKQHVLFSAVHYSKETPPDLIPIPLIVEEKGWTDGLILAGAIYPNFLKRIISLDIPFVAFGNNVFGVDGQRQFDQVCYDGIRGEFEATQYLISQGHRSIAFAGDTSYPWFREQYQGYISAMRAAKLNPISLTSRRQLSFIEYGEWAAAQLMARMTPPTAILAGNDEIAYGLWRALRRLGVLVPGNVSLVGFDDRELALLMDPLLTTVCVNKEGRAKNV